MADQRLGGYNYKTLLCTNIPELFLDKYVARTHFGRFGTLVNFVLRPRRMTCTVSYATEAEAELALREGTDYNGHAFDICYAENESAPAQKTEEWVDPDVQAELNALSAGWRSEYTAGSGGASGAKSKWAATNSNSNNSSTTNTTNSNSRTALPPPLRQRAPAPAPAPQFMAVKQELEALMRRPAYTNEEKYRVLDARDKLLRLNERLASGKDRDISSAHTTQGHCPDMCPEKERLLREFQRQVAVYELLPDSDSCDTIAHELAVKQYSRSSADQETPLPHELRSEPVLHMTMAYLMHEVMDSCEQAHMHTGDWFHFVWDRTRSIRKEITQQELCSLGAVKLVEQCARFHIHCAARLVAEEPSVFDSKINAENLTKCLQTLKYMYHDLRLKGVQCPREAEFRGYIVLLNLADANFLWDIGQLPVELQSCSQIRHAIKFYLALQDTNFVRFFQLVREPETSYLSACILVTYFTRLRVLALRRIIQSYRAPRKLEISSLPLSHVSRMLGCATEAEAADFVDHYGLSITEQSRVVLSRMELPETEYRLQRQFVLVESKRQHSVGEVVCGEPLPLKSLYQLHRPHNSFDAQGYLKNKAWAAKDQRAHCDSEPEEEVVEKPQRISSAPPEDSIFKVPLMSAPMSPKIKIESKLTAPIETPALFGNAAFAGRATPIAPAYNGGSIFATQQPSAAAAAAASSTPAPLTLTGFSFGNVDASTAAAAAAEQEQQKHQQQRAAAEAARLETLQQAIAAAKQREAELLALQAAKMAREEHQQRQQQQQKRQERQQQQQREAQRQESLLNGRCEQLLHALIHCELTQLCGIELQLHNSAMYAYNQLVDATTAQLAEQALRTATYELGLMRCYWRRWRGYRRMQQQKDALFSQLPLSYGAENSNRLLDRAAEAAMPLRMMRRYRQGEPCNYRMLLAGLEEDAWLKLDLWLLLSRLQETHQQTTPGTRRYFKLLLSLPAGEQGLRCEHALDRGLLQRPALTGQPHCPETLTTSTSPYILGLAHGVALCVHKLKGGQSEAPPSAAVLANADGYICFVCPTQLEESHLRLQQLKCSGASYAAIIVLQQPQSQAQSTPLEEAAITHALQLDKLSLRAYRIYGQQLRRHRSDQLVPLLQRAVQFIAAQPHRSRSALQQTELREWLVEQVGGELFHRLRHAGQQDAMIARHSRTSPHFGLQLYNEALRRLQLVAGEDLQARPQLPVELRPFVVPLLAQMPLPNRLEHFAEGWQTPAYRSRIVALLEQAKLPEMRPLPASGDESELCEWLLAYAQRSQDEAMVESVALQAAQTLALGDEAHYLGLVEIFAKERLQFVLRRAQPLPPAIVYRRSTMRSQFQVQWYYEWQQLEAVNGDSDSNDGVDVEVDASNESVPTIAIATDDARYDDTYNGDDADAGFEVLLSHAKGVLDKCKRRREDGPERRTLADLNDPLDHLERTMQRCEQLKTSLSGPGGNGSDSEDGEQLENLAATPPKAKRVRLGPGRDQYRDLADYSTLLDRTECLLDLSQFTQLRRRQMLQRANKFL